MQIHLALVLLLVVVCKAQVAIIGLVSSSMEATLGMGLDPDAVLGGLLDPQVPEEQLKYQRAYIFAKDGVGALGAFTHKGLEYIHDLLEENNSIEEVQKILSRKAKFLTSFFELDDFAPVTTDLAYAERSQSTTPESDLTESPPLDESSASSSQSRRRAPGRLIPPPLASRPSIASKLSSGSSGSHTMLGWGSFERLPVREIQREMTAQHHARRPVVRRLTPVDSSTFFAKSKEELSWPDCDLYGKIASLMGVSRLYRIGFDFDIENSDEAQVREVCNNGFALLDIGYTYVNIEEGEPPSHLSIADK